MLQIVQFRRSGNWTVIELDLELPCAPEQLRVMSSHECIIYNGADVPRAELHLLNLQNDSSDASQLVNMLFGTGERRKLLDPNCTGAGMWIYVEQWTLVLFEEMVKSSPLYRVKAHA